MSDPVGALREAEAAITGDEDTDRVHALRKAARALLDALPEMLGESATNGYNHGIAEAVETEWKRHDARNPFRRETGDTR